MKYLLYVFILIISGCSGSHPTVYPDRNNLSTAIVNQKYQEIIEIKGGAVNESSVSVSLTPNDSGLTWGPEEIKYSFGEDKGINRNYHHIIISGIPKKAGEYNVIVSGFTLGTTSPGKDFYKKYIIEIEQ